MALLAPRRSLRSRALQLLAQREHSRAELRRKLIVHALAELVAPGGPEAADAPAPAEPVERADRAEQARLAADRVEAELDWLESQRHLSADRFVESRVHARASRFGNLRIRQELARHELGLPDEAAQSLKASEFDRAVAVLARKYPAAPTDAADRARRARFLAARGFSAETIRHAVRAAGTLDAELADRLDDAENLG